MAKAITMTMTKTMTKIRSATELEAWVRVYVAGVQAGGKGVIHADQCLKDLRERCSEELLEGPTSTLTVRLGGDAPRHREKPTRGGGGEWG